MDLFREFYCNEFDPADIQQECLAAKIKLSIFLIAGDCVGLPVLAWALCVLYRHCKSGHQISGFMIMLLLCDLLVLLLNPYMVIKLLQKENYRKDTTCWILSSFWSASVISALYLQQVVALEGALSVRHPLFSAHVFFPPCFIIMPFIVFIYFFLCELLGSTLFVILGLPCLIVITLMSWIVTCRAPPHVDNTAYRTVKPSFVVLTFVTFTLVLHVTFFSIHVILWTPRRYWKLLLIYLCVMSVRVLTDPLLCVMICRKNLRTKKSEPNIDTELT